MGMGARSSGPGSTRNRVSGQVPGGHVGSSAQESHACGFPGAQIPPATFLPAGTGAAWEPRRCLRACVSDLLPGSEAPHPGWMRSQ